MIRVNHFFRKIIIITAEIKQNLKPSILLTTGKIGGFKLYYYRAQKNILSGINYQQTNAL